MIHMTTNDFPTDKQIAWARTLLEERKGIEAAESVRGYLNEHRIAETLTRLRMSNAIDRLIAIPKPKPAAKPVAGTLDEGMYQKDGEIYRVVRSKNTGRPYAKRLRKEDAGEGKKLDFEFDRDYIRTLTPANRMTLDEAKAAGVLMGACCVCGATLTNEVSVREGIGPVCGGRV